MKKKIAVFKSGVANLAQGLPSNIAASIGRTLVRHTYMESLQREAINLLLEISIKQGRLIVRLPQPKQYPRLIQTLLQFHGLYPKRVNFNRIAPALDAADRARNALAHSLIIKKDGYYFIQLVRGLWELDQKTFSVSRALQPEGVPLDAAYLKARRAEVELGITGAKNLVFLIRATMKALNEKRRRQVALDRRRHQTGNTRPAQP